MTNTLFFVKIQLSPYLDFYHEDSNVKIKFMFYYTSFIIMFSK